MKLNSMIVMSMVLLYSTAAFSSECVILLHGLARTADSMSKLETTLEQKGYRVANIDYPSRKMKIEALAELALTRGLDECRLTHSYPVNFVTHSLGGILVRQYYSSHRTDNVKRVVMLGPPNNGSEVVDHLKHTPGFELLNGPAGVQLGTDDDSVPVQLGPVNFELGIIAGTKSVNLILSSFLPNPDDGKVSVESTKVEGMCSFIALAATHPFMMNNDAVIGEVLSFLQNGKFDGEAGINSEC